jgi:2-amino-4-hydroxy-6-hydroxymethyldihydropteridine diphosphokinase
MAAFQMVEPTPARKGQSMPEPVVVYIGLGANLGDARDTVLRAMDAIADIDGVMLTRQSSLYATAPVDSSGPDYVNAVVELITVLKPKRLLERLQDIEAGFGRLRPHRNAPRTLDLDILLYGDRRMDRNGLTVPHPRMEQRAFVLVPLAEIAPHCVREGQLQAVKGQSIARLE